MDSKKIVKWSLCAGLILGAGAALELARQSANQEGQLRDWEQSAARVKQTEMALMKESVSCRKRGLTQGFDAPDGKAGNEDFARCMLRLMERHGFTKAGSLVFYSGALRARKFELDASGEAAAKKVLAFEVALVKSKRQELEDKEESQARANGAALASICAGNLEACAVKMGIEPFEARSVLPETVFRLNERSAQELWKLEHISAWNQFMEKHKKAFAEKGPAADIGEAKPWERSARGQLQGKGAEESSASAMALVIMIRQLAGRSQGN